jgi:hypothetical protein
MALEQPLVVSRVGIVVDDATATAEFFERLLGTRFRIDDEATKQVRVAKCDAGVLFVQDISPDGLSSPARPWWNGGLCNIGIDVPLDQLEAVRAHFESLGIRAVNYVEMETGFKDYSFEPYNGILITVYAYPGDSWMEAAKYEGDDPLVDIFFDLEEERPAPTA